MHAATYSFTSPNIPSQRTNEKVQKADPKSPAHSEYHLATLTGSGLLGGGLFLAGVQESWLSWSGILAIPVMWFGASILFMIGFSKARPHLHSSDDFADPVKSLAAWQE